MGLLLVRLLLNPTWLKWLEREHADIIPFLKVEIQEYGIKNLDSQINTQEELEEWVLAVRKKYKGIP